MDKKRFVMLGERYSNGRIAKNEHYSVDEFVDKVRVNDQHGGQDREIKIGILDVLFKKRLELKLARLHDKSYWAGHNMAFGEIKGRINHLIESDSFGKKK